MKKQLQDIHYLYKINNVILERNLLQPYQRILIAVSGGQDSICILKVLSFLKKKWMWKLGIVHCDHRWSSSSQLQLKHVGRLAVSMQIDFYQAVSINSVKKETVARNWRYNIIKTIAREHNYSTVITAHSGSDRIETLLYHLIRGSGLQGIQSINWKRQLNFIRFILWKTKINSSQIIIKRVVYCKMDCFIIKKQSIRYLELIRPLLGTTRSEIRHLLSLWNLPSWPDSSNQIITIRRNRIRGQLIPYIRLHYNPKLDQALARWSEIVYAENIYLNRLTFMILSKIEVRINNSFYNICTNGIDIAVLRSCPIVFQRRILKLFLYKHIKVIVSFRYIEHIRLFFLCNQQSGPIIQPKKKTKDICFQLKYPSISLPSKGKLLVFSHFLILLYT